MNTKDIGDLSESAVVKELKSMGYTVLTPFGDNASYDVVYDNGKELKKVQVKHGRVDDRAVKATLEKCRHNGKSMRHEKYEEGDLDEYMIYCSEKDIVYVVPFEDAPETEICLRFESETDHPSIRWAIDYEI